MLCDSLCTAGPHHDSAVQQAEIPLTSHRQGQELCFNNGILSLVCMPLHGHAADFGECCPDMP